MEFVLILVELGGKKKLNSIEKKIKPIKLTVYYNNYTTPIAATIHRSIFVKYRRNIKHLIKIIVLMSYIHGVRFQL